MTLQPLADFVAQLSLAETPEEVVLEARRQLLDCIGVIIGGAMAAEVQALAAIEGKEGGRSTFLGQGGYASAEAAALVNGAAGVWLDFDSGQRASGSHPAIHVVAAALAVAEEVDATWEELLTAVIAGCEVGARIGVAAGRLRPGMSPHGGWAVLGAAAAVARLLGYDAAGIAATINLASSLTVLSSASVHQAGANGRHLQAGLGAKRGIVAARLHADGFTGDPEGVQQVFGRFVTPSFNPRRATIELGRHWEMRRGYFKPYACARFGHAAIDALLAIRRERMAEGSAAEDIESIEVVTFNAAAALADPHPTTELGAKFSLPFTLAAAWVRGDAGPASFDAAARRHAAIRQLAERVRLREDPDYTALVPDYRPALVTVRFRDGSVMSVERLNATGEADDPTLSVWLIDKFNSLVEPVIGPAAATLLRERLLSPATAFSVRELTALAVPP
ncbi:MAG: MmgE/PrpD family protein [Chloroflexota bacterium]|nr:MmgE/PrpD family protein [Dehalococcoidia bacterium]MDW8253046.1 MmgE/PrpD family protein [Chloroflexota bacterium]